MERKEKIEAALLEFAASVWNLSGPVWADEDMCSDTREKLDKALSAIETEMPRWIPCEERLPEMGVPALAAYRNGCMLPSKRVAYDNSVWDWRDIDGNFSMPDSVSHWQPLPAAPKEVEE